MKVLYLCHRVPYPPDKGEKIRAFHQLRAISARHEVDLFTLADDPQDLQYKAELERYCRKVIIVQIASSMARFLSLRVLGSGKPLTLPYFYSRKLDREIRSALDGRSYDRIFVYCSAMAQYVERAARIPLLMDFVDVDSDKWFQYALHKKFPLADIYRREGVCLQNYERRICEKASKVLVTTEREAVLVRELSSGADVHVIPNGVDTTYFSPVARMCSSPTIIFTGDMSYFPNQQAVKFFAMEVLPLIQRQAPDAKFLIVGRRPSIGVQRLGDLDGVEVTGFVPDVRTYLARATVAVAPFAIAAGIQNKILEALASGLPVVATPRAVQGLSSQTREMVQTGETVEELAAKTLSFLRDSAYAMQIGLEGRRRVSMEYSWENSLGQLMALIENPLGERVHESASRLLAKVL